MRQALYTLCALLLLALPIRAAQAAETLDEKVYDPGQRPPATDAVPPPAPTPAPTPDGRVTPGQTQGQPSGGGDTIIVVPSTPGQTVPGQPAPDQNATVPVQPDTQKEAPTIVLPSVPPVPPVPPVPTVPPIPAVPAVPAVPMVPMVPTIPVIPVVPEIPKNPDAEKKESIVTPITPVQPEEKTAPKTSPAEDKVLTPADFLPTTPEKKEPEKAEAKTKEEPRKGKLEKTPAEAQQDKATPEKAEGKPGKTDPKKDKPSPEKKKGEALRIPADAGKTGKMDFLEGCWKGRLSGRAGDEVIDNMGSRFCFDANGKGKHFLYDPKRNETCVGSANGGVKPDGTLRVDFDNLYCPSGETWYPQGDKYMTCRDGGNGADCKWYYKGQPRTTGPFHRD